MKSLPKLPIKLRGHHLICLHFFKGEGYNPEFIKNLWKIIKRAEDGEDIEAYPGPDDVCAMCPYLKGKICFYDNEAESEIKEMDRKAFTLLELKSGDRVKWSNINGKIPDIFNAWFHAYCLQCAWRQACQKEEKFLRFIKGLPK
ncbi:MAG: DUF1284 domain-containing protein [Nitrospira sp.]|nr:DUF1284 domain-containing protein [Nitrospira sp.]